ncbi:MAG: Gfo/Idh/MocA family oxidoreductase [Planctomycetaceae bacterium]|nr:Gfo/Idh/MocA family oxidoreductase [Planctomycetaceae bacterium]
MTSFLHTKPSRRGFLKQTGLLAATGTAIASQLVPHVHASENNTIKIALIGSGNRGRGAAIQALAADDNVKLWTIADAFPERARNAGRIIKDELDHQNQGHKVDVPPERSFGDLDGYIKAMDTLSAGDLVLLTSPPAFRPLHFAYAVQKGLHIFAEKPVAVDVPGLKSMQETNRQAEAKGLKVAVGLNNRHVYRTEEIIQAIHGGELGELIAFYVYRCENAHSLGRQGDFSPLQHQLRRIFNFNWLTGGFIVDALIHNLDICSWAHQKRPVAALGMGGRLFRQDQDELIDNANVQYTFDDGKIMNMYTVAMANTWHGFRAVIHGSKGSAVLGEGVNDPRMFADWNAQRPSQRPFWAPRSDWNDSYQTQHNRFFKAIRENTAWNEMERGVEATFTAVMGRMAMETGQLVTADEAWASTFQYAPNLADLRLGHDSPTMPDANGNYRIPRPGRATIDEPFRERIG